MPNGSPTQRTRFWQGRFFVRWFLFATILWLTACVLVLSARMLGFLSDSWISFGYLLVTVFTSLLAVAAFGYDKLAAKGNRRRISEKTLHLLALAGGWPGAVIGQQLFRHKTQKLAFRISLPVIAALHTATVLFLKFWF